MTIWARVTTRFEAIHNYPNAPKGVEFLKHPHRHEFHVTLWIEQFHDDRDVEYILCKRWLQEWLRTFAESHVLNLGAISCEMLALAVGIAAQAHYSLQVPGDILTARRVMVEVTEDGENGALVEM